MESRAAVWLGPETGLEIRTIRVDEPGPGRVRVKLHACGLCHTDQSVLDGSLPSAGPIVMGHEGGGVVEAIGDGVNSLAVGDHVVMTTSGYCGRCYWCIEGQFSQCANMPLRSGGTGAPPFHLGDVDLSPYASVGCLTEYTVVGERSAVRIDPEVPLDSAALLGCGVYTGVGSAINTAKVRPGTSCAVWGAGGIGLSAIQGCRISGASKIVAIDTNPRKLALAQTVGATDVIDASSQDPVQEVFGLTEGRGADYTFEAIGNPQAMEQAHMGVRNGGTCTIVGVGGFTDTFSLPAAAFALSEKTLKGSFIGGGASNRDFPRMLNWYKEGKLKLDELVTTRYPLDDAQKAFDDMVAGKNARGVIVF